MLQPETAHLILEAIPESTQHQECQHPAQRSDNRPSELLSPILYNRIGVLKSHFSRPVG